MTDKPKSKFNKYIISLHPIFQENALILSQRTGLELKATFDPKENDLVIVFGGHDKSSELLYLQKQKDFKFGYIIIATEQMNSVVYDNKNYITLLKKNLVFPFSFEISKQLKLKYEIDSHSLYFFDFFNIEDTIDFKDRPIDFFFCGCKSDLRDKQIELLRKKMPDKKIEVDYDYSYTTPLELMKKLTQVKYVLNIPFYENSSLETHRIHRALSASCKVLSLKPYLKYEEEGYDEYVIFVDSLDDFKDRREGTEPLNEWSLLMEKVGNKVLNHNLATIQNL